MLAARLVFATLSLLAVDAAYDLRWRPTVGQVSEYRVQANGTVHDQPIKAIATLRAQVQTVTKGKVTALSLSTSAGAISTSQGRTELPGLSLAAYDLTATEEPDTRGLGIFGNVPTFLYRTVTGNTVRIGQTWKVGLDRRLKAEAVETVGASEAVRVSLASSSYARNQIEGTYWISVTDGAVLKAKIHTKTQLGGEDDPVSAEWTITIDRLNPKAASK